MLVDSFFEQGVTHEVCEDYARHGVKTIGEQKIHYAVVADGCSNAGGSRIDTDWGARLLSLTAENDAIDLEEPLDFVYHIGNVARKRHSTLLPTMPPECMCATLLALRYWEPHHSPYPDSIQAIVCGDGVTGGKRRDGTWVIHNIEFLPGGKLNLAAPYYLKYFMFDQSDQWVESFGKSLVIRTYTGNLFDPAFQWPNLEADRTQLWQTIMTCEEEQGEWDIRAPFEWFDYPVDEYEFAFVASDGPGSFYMPTKTATSKHNTPLHL